MFFFTIFAYGNMAILLGPNPLRWKNTLNRGTTQFDQTGVQMVLKANQYMGVSEETLKLIEKDLLE